MSQDLSPVVSLSKDIAKAAKDMTDDEARYLVDAYYIMQEDRKRANHQARTMDLVQEPNAVINWLAAQSTTLENQIKRALDKYTSAHVMGEWMRSIYGIGPVLSAGLLAHIKIEKAPTVGHIWRFAGLDPTVTWEKGKVRPWNATLKTLCWKIGQSFMKMSGSPECYYGDIYRKRKDYEITRNERGDNQELALKLSEKIDKSKPTYAWLTGCFKPEDVQRLRDSDKLYTDMDSIKGKPGSGIPMLPPAQIDARARRYAVKLFLSHLHDVWYRRHFNEAPPKPYAIAFLGHAHYIAPPVPA